MNTLKKPLTLACIVLLLGMLFGSTPAQVQTAIIIILNQPPDCSGAAIADQAAGPNCDVTISATDVTGVTDPDGDALTIMVSPTTLSLGGNTVTVDADDGNGGMCSIDITVNVVDDTDPVITPIANAIELWPPNHKYVTIDVSDCVSAVSDNCNTTLSASDVVITMATSDEEEDAKGGGDGKTKNDIVIDPGCQSVQLRAERQGGGNGRVYTIHMSVDDGNGNTGTATCQVSVPKSQNGNPAVDDGLSGYGESCGLSKLAVPTDDATVQATIPEGYALEQNHPNPFNPSTTITFAVPEASEVKLAIYNLRGQLIQTLHSGLIAAGQHNVVWDGTDSRGAKVASGVYVYRLEAKDLVMTKKLVFTK